MLVKAEVAALGDNPRFVVTNLRGAALGLYNLYAARGEMENRIKKLQCVSLRYAEITEPMAHHRHGASGAATDSYLRR